MRFGAVRFVGALNLRLNASFVDVLGFAPPPPPSTCAETAIPEEKIKTAIPNDVK
jgi:hypothetical protein